MNTSDYSVEDLNQLWEIVDSYFEFPKQQET